jgi:hypothetical protein
LTHTRVASQEGDIRGEVEYFQDGAVPLHVHSEFPQRASVPPSFCSRRAIKPCLDIEQRVSRKRFFGTTKVHRTGFI